MNGPLMPTSNGKVKCMIRTLGKIPHLLWPHDGQLMHLGPLPLIRINRVSIVIPPSSTLAICAIIPARDKVILPSNLCPSALTRCKYQVPSPKYLCYLEDSSCRICTSSGKCVYGGKVTIRWLAQTYRQSTDEMH